MEVKGKSSPINFLELGCPAGPYSDRPRNLPGWGRSMFRVSGLECSGQLFSSSHCCQWVLAYGGPPNPEAPGGSWCSGFNLAATALLESVSPTPVIYHGTRMAIVAMSYSFRAILNIFHSFFLVFNSSFQIECYLLFTSYCGKEFSHILYPSSYFQSVTLQFSLVCSF